MRGRDAQVGEVLIPSDTPEGPWKARAAWALALGQVLLVYQVPTDDDPDFLVLPPGHKTPVRYTPDALDDWDRAPHMVATPS